MHENENITGGTYPQLSRLARRRKPFYQQIHYTQQIIIWKYITTRM